MTKRKLPKKLQIYHLEKSIRKRLEDEYSNSDIDTEAEIMDNLDLEKLVDDTLEYEENYKNIVKFINQKFGVLGADYSLIYKAETHEYEEELKNFRETLRTEFNKEGYDLDEDQFELLLGYCASLFSTKTLVHQVRDVENLSVRSIVNLLKPPASKPAFPNIYEA